jgi:hypothetical protein
MGRVKALPADGKVQDWLERQAWNSCANRGCRMSGFHLLWHVRLTQAL